MKITSTDRQPELSQLVERIQHLKQEHGPLLTRIRSDSGMSADLRRELLQHLNDEEAEIITKLAAIAPDVAARYRPGMAGPAIGNRPRPPLREAPVEAPSRLTVGSLRALPASPSRGPAGSGPAASARTAGRQAPLSIGSLRPR